MNIPSFTPLSLLPTQDVSVIAPSQQFFFNQVGFTTTGSLTNVGDVPISQLSLINTIIIDHNIECTVNSSLTIAPQVTVRLLSQNGFILLSDTNSLQLNLANLGCRYVYTIRRLSDRYTLFVECLGRFRSPTANNITSSTFSNDQYLCRRLTCTSVDILPSDTFVRSQIQYLSAGDGTLNFTSTVRAYLQ